MATKDDLTSIAEYVWRYISPKIEEQLSHNVRWYRAKVTKAAQDGRISVQRPFDSTVQSLPYIASMSTANVGDEVTVFTFGGASGGNNDNSVIVNNGSYSYFSDDFVVAHGIAGNWSYTKCASGIAMCWKRIGITGKAITTAKDGIYICASTGIPSSAYPFPFSSPPSEFVGLRIGSGNVWTLGPAHNTNAVSASYGLASLESIASASGVANIFAIGTWK